MKRLVSIILTITISMNLLMLPVNVESNGGVEGFVA